MKKLYLKIKGNISYYLIYLMFIMIVFINVKSKLIVGDEPFTVHMINHSFINIIKLTSRDVHPFLYYFIAKIFTYNVNDIMLKTFILRLVNVLPYLIVLIIGNIYIKNKFSKLTSKIFMLSMISMPLFVDNISYIRMYGWATLFTIIFYIMFMHAYNDNNIKSFILLSLYALMASYTHYYAFITVGIVYFIFLILFILQKMKLRYMIMSIVINLILYLPWIFVIINQSKKATNNYWSSKIKISDVFHIALGIVSPIYHISVFYILSILLIILLLIVIFNKNINKDKMFLLNIIHLFLPFILILFGVLASIIVHHSLLLMRYIMPAMGIFWLAISIIIDKIHNKEIILKKMLIFITILISLISYIKLITHNISSFSRTNESVDMIRKLPKNALFVYNNPNVMYDFSIYNNNNVLKVPYADTSFSTYNKVFNNIKENDDINLPTKRKNVFYIEDKNDDSQFNSKLSRKFGKRYSKKKINEIYLSNNWSVIIYKIILL